MKKILLFLLLVGAALAGMGYWLFWPRHASVSEKMFTYASVQQGTMVEAVSATGLLEPAEVVLVTSELPGSVVRILSQVNDTVEEGAVLAELNDHKIELKYQEAVQGVAQARALKEAAEKALAYQKELESKGGFRAEREQADAQFKAAAARLRAVEVGLQEAKLALDLTKVRAPSRGNASHNPRTFIVIDRQVKVGQMIGPASPTPLFVLAGDLENMEVHAQVAEGDIGRIKRGLTAGFSVSAFSDVDMEFRGTVKDIRPMPSNVKGAVFYDTVIGVKNQKDDETGDWRLRPGMTAAVDIVRRKHENVWKVPSAALNFQMDEAYQSAAARARLAEWKQRADCAEWRPVWVWDEQRRRPWPVFVRIGGLKNGAPGLKDGEFNEVLEWEPGRQPAPGARLPRVITKAPPARAPGFFDQPAGIKVS